MKSKKRTKSQPVTNHPAIVPEDLIRQAGAFTAPRGRLEMGGLLLGHVDAEGNSVAVTGLFPEQLKESSGYCEFDGMWTALAAAACDHANQIGENGTPELRVIGWIHTHPDIGIFLSGIDVTTYRALRNATPDRRFMAVVVDPLREENGVFLTENKPNVHSPAAGAVQLDDELKQRYHAMLDRLEEIRNHRGLESLPGIIPGPLRAERMMRGARDDVGIELERGFFSMKRELHTLQTDQVSMQTKIAAVQGLSRTCQTLAKRVEATEMHLKSTAKRLKSAEEELVHASARHNALVDAQSKTADHQRKSRGIMLRLIDLVRGKPTDN